MAKPKTVFFPPSAAAKRSPVVVEKIATEQQEQFEQRVGLIESPVKLVEEPAVKLTEEPAPDPSTVTPDLDTQRKALEAEIRAKVEAEARADGASQKVSSRNRPSVTSSHERADFEQFTTQLTEETVEFLHQTQRRMKKQVKGFEKYHVLQALCDAAQAKPSILKSALKGWVPDDVLKQIFAAK